MTNPFTPKFRLKLTLALSQQSNWVFSLQTLTHEMEVVLMRARRVRLAQPQSRWSAIWYEGPKFTPRRAKPGVLRLIKEKTR